MMQLFYLIAACILTTNLADSAESVETSTPPSTAAEEINKWNEFQERVDTYHDVTLSLVLETRDKLDRVLENAEDEKSENSRATQPKEGKIEEKIRKIPKFQERVDKYHEVTLRLVIEMNDRLGRVLEQNQQ